MIEARFELFGVSPADVWTPESVAEVQEAVHEGVGKAIVPWGGGTRQHLGYPPERYDVALLMERLAKITDYQPADMTITAQAGVTIETLQGTLAERGQCLPIDVALPGRQTVGGVIATRADSLRRFQFGSVRDQLLGVTVIDSRGQVIQGGGRVVKNVAGYDLPKLYCGSLGTLGVIAEATFKVAPVPEASATLVLPLPAEHNSEDVLDTLLSSDLVFSCLVLLNANAAFEILGDRATDTPKQYVVACFDGLAETVNWQVETLGSGDGLLGPDEAVLVRAKLRDYSLADAPMTAAFHILSSQVGAFARMVEWTARRAGFQASVMADAGLGLMWAHFAPEREDAHWGVFYPDLLDKATRCGGSFILERMPSELRALDTSVWLPILKDFELMTGLKEALDPQRMWNPGRFVGKL